MGGLPVLAEAWVVEARGSDRIQRAVERPERRQVQTPSAEVGTVGGLVKAIQGGPGVGKKTTPETEAVHHRVFVISATTREAGRTVVAGGKPKAGVEPTGVSLVTEAVSAAGPVVAAALGTANTAKGRFNPSRKGAVSKTLVFTAPTNHHRYRPSC